tara:strand:- start:247 stop:1107 length:861 start_codon:yes stop_codon:yes gene_type:complete
MIDITILIVAYKNNEILIQNISKLNNFNIIVIDNDNSSNLKNKLIKFNNVKYYKLPKNLGEGYAANKGLEFINSKYTLYLNPDTLIDEKNILSLKTIFNENSNVGVVAPMHFNINNKYIGNYFSHPLLQRIKRNYFEKKIYNSLDKIKPSGNFCARVIWGAPLFFNTIKIKKIGFFDPEFFLFFEDVDLCDRLNNIHLQIIETPFAFCYHLNENLSSKSVKYLFLTSSNFIRSQILYFKKNSQSTLKFYLRGFEYFINSLFYLIKLNKLKFYQNIFRLYGVLRSLF